mgnify:CR=1 FL=1
MANVSVKISDDFKKKLDGLTAEMEAKIIPEMLEAGGRVCEYQVRTHLAESIGNSIDSRATGELMAALGTSPVKQDRQGNWDVKIGFREPRHDGKSNAMIANILEYGKSNQPARPFLKQAEKASKLECEQVMSQVFNEEVAKL